MENFISFKAAICSTPIDFYFWGIVSILILLSFLRNWQVLNNISVLTGKAFLLYILVAAFFFLIGVLYMCYGYGYSSDNYKMKKLKDDNILITRRFKCALCGAEFLLFSDMVENYVYKKRFRTGVRYYCRYNCWIKK